MEEKLPVPIRLTLDRALARYSEWRGVDVGPGQPKPVRLLGDGANNCSVLVVSGRQQFVVRIARLDRAANGLDPAAERQALERAAAARIAPTLRHFEPDGSVLVCDYLEPDPEPRAGPAELGALLRAIHTLEPIPAQLSLPRRIDHYERALARRTREGPGHAELGSLKEGARKGLRQLQSIEGRPVLCHNDLLPPNCIEHQGRFWVLDWEYAATGNRWFDLAVACEGHALDDDGTRKVLVHYLGRPAGSIELGALAAARSVYRYLERLWTLVNASGEPAGG